MSVDKLVDSTQLDSDLTSVANAIRTKGGTSAQLAFPADFVSAITAIPSGGGGLSVATFTATATATDATISFAAGDYSIPDKYVLFIKSDVAAGDGVNICITSGFETHQRIIPIITLALNAQGNYSAQGRYFVYKANGDTDSYSPGDGAQTHLTKSGSTLSLKFNNNHKFKSGGTYTIQVYELDDTFFS